MKSLTTFLTLMFITSLSLTAHAKIICEENNSTTFSSTKCIEQSKAKSKKSTNEPFLAYHGHITEDMTWSDDYMIYGDVTIIDGVTLTIEAGVNLLFFQADSNQDQIGDIDFIVHGQLQCNGTEENPVVFKSYNENPQASDWGGIDYLNTDADENSLMEHTWVWHAYEGVHINGINLNYTTGKVQFSGKYGIRISQNTHANISDIDISDGLGSGIGGEIEQALTALEDFSLTPVALFNNCSSIRNQQHGVFINNLSPVLDNNLIAFNKWSGVNVTGKNSKPALNKCSIQSNNNSGFYFENLSNGKVVYCTIIKNKGMGIKIAGNSTPSFNENNIVSNFGIDDIGDNSEIYEMTFSNYEWYINGTGTVVHPKSKFSHPIQILNLTYQKDGDWFNGNYAKDKYRHYTGIIIEGITYIYHAFAIEDLCDYSSCNYDMPQIQYSGSINKVINDYSEIKLSISYTHNCPNARAWVTKYTYKSVSPNGYQVSVLNDPGILSDFTNNWWGTRQNVDSLIYQANPGTIEYAVYNPFQFGNITKATTGTAKILSTTSANLTATINPVGIQTTYFFEYGTSTNYTHKTQLTPAGSGSSDITVNQTITDLEPNTQYYFRIVTENINGRSETVFGEDQSFKTPPVPQPTLSIGEHSGVKNMIVSIPLYLDNPMQVPIEGIEASVALSKTVLEPLDVTITDTLLDNISHSFDYNTDIENTIIVAIAIQTESFVQSGTIAMLRFNVNGQPGNHSKFNIIRARVNETDIPSKNGEFTVFERTDFNTISGTIAYYSNQQPISNANVHLFNTDNQTKKSDSNGFYAFNALSRGEYGVNVSKDTEKFGLSSTDASTILRHVVKKHTFNCYEQIAGDVTLDGSISATDAARLAKYIAYQLTGNDSKYLNDDMKDWTFVASPIDNCDHWPPIAYDSTSDINLTTELFQQDFTGVRIGDVNGSWDDYTVTQDKRSNNIKNDDPVTIRFEKDSTFTIPIRIREKTLISGVDIAIEFDGSVVVCTSGSLNDGILKNYKFEQVMDQPNVSAMIIYTSDTIESYGQIAELSFHVVGEINSETNISFKTFQCNDQPATGGFFVNGKYTKSVHLTVTEANREDQAIIIAGGKKHNSNTLWDTTENLCNKFYQKLLKRKYTHDQIMYLSDHSLNYDLKEEDEILVVDVHHPTVNDIQTTIESLHNPYDIPKLDAHTSLVIYMMDHGGIGKFQVNKGEYLNATDFDLWLDNLQAATDCTVVVIVEACHSGTFIELLKPTTDQKRILMSSSNKGLSLTDDVGLKSFSHFLFEHIDQGSSLQFSFEQTRMTLSKLKLFKDQDPQIFPKFDTSLAENFNIGGTFVTADTLPEILASTESKSITAGIVDLFVQASSLVGIQKVWASIVSPMVKLPEIYNEFESPMINSKAIDLEYSDEMEQYENQFQFLFNGRYIVTFFVKDIKGNAAIKEIELSVQNGLIPGDYNGDKQVSLMDAILALQSVADMGKIESVMDVNDNGRIDSGEVVFVLGVVSGVKGI